ncbi:hypothetical protein Tco_0967331 [Tanacetum coccineum]
MLRQRCNSGEEHQYHVDQMQNYFKNNIVWERRKERLSLSTPKKKASVIYSCQRDPKALLMTLLNQDLLYLKHGNSRTKKYILSLHKYPVVPFLDDDIEEQTLRWVNKCIKRFNSYAQYSVEHWKNIWVKQFHIRGQKEKRDNPKEKVLEMLKKYNKDVKYGYVDPSLNDDDVEYLRYYKEDIKDRLKHRDQMRRW